MDWNATNNSNQSSWSTRRQKTDPNQVADGSAGPGVAYEWLIDACNRTSSNMWITIPHLADQNYCNQLATLIKNTLSPSLKVYVEYSNECWNTGFQQATYCNNQGVAMGFDTDPTTAGAKYYVYAACKAFREFDIVFGAPSSRVVKVLAGQNGNVSRGEIHFTALANPTINPNNVVVNAYAVAPYVGLGLDGSSPTIFTDLNNGIASAAAALDPQKAQVNSHGMQMIAYEGGQHVLTNAQICNRDAQMYTFYTNYFNAMKSRFDGVFCHYAHCGSFSSGGAWGAEESTGQSISTAHKLRAIFDWITNNSGAQVPAPPAGLVAVPGDAQVALSWNSIGGATSYTVKRSTVSGSGYANVVSQAGLTYTNTGLTNGTTYYFVVSASNATGQSANSAQVSATPTAPAAIANTASAPTIDGNVDASWASATSYTLSKQSGTISSGADLTVTWKGMWDATNFYGLVDVTDDVKNNDSANVWDDDTVEFFIDGGNNKTSFYDSNDRQILLAWNDAAPTEGGGRSITGVTFAKADPSSTSYRMEVKIPWSTLGVTAAANNLVGIEIQTDDDDDGTGRDGKKMWNDGTDQSWANPSLFGTTKLMPAAGGAPAAPTGLTATAGNGQIALSWNASSGATTYNVSRSTVSGSGYASVATGIVPTSYTNTGLSNCTAYFFVVSATNANGTSGNSAQASATPTPAAPAAPTGLTATPGDTQVALSWTASAGATSYNVLRSTVSGSGYASVATGVVPTSYTNTGLTNGTAYYYVVQAVNCNSTSANSAQVSATPIATPQAQIPSGTVTVDGTVDSAWSGATAYNITHVFGTVTNGSDLSATWKGLWDSTNLYFLIDVTDDVKTNDSANAWDDDAPEVFIDGNNSKGTSYDGANDIQYVFGWGDAAVVLGVNSPAGRTTGVTFAKADPTGTTYRIEIKIPWTTIGVTPAANALVGVDVHIDDDDNGAARDGALSWNDAIDQAWTNPSTFGTGKLLAPAGPPAAPTGLVATPGSGQVALLWNASSGATSYNVKRSTVSGSGYAQVTNVATTSYTNTGLSAGTYYYVVTALNAGGESGNSNQASATVQTNVPPVPTGLAATPSSTQVALTWNASSGATAYDVKRSTVSGSGYATVSSPTTTSYTNTGLTNGVTYYYVVAAKNTAGSSANSSQVAAAPFLVNIKNTGTAITIDGTVDAAWSGATAYTMANNIFGTAVPASDISGTFKALWDATNLYVLFQITDDLKKNDSTNNYDDDAVEVFVDGNYSHGTTYDTIDDVQYVFGWGDTTFSTFGITGHTAGITFAKADPTGTSYVVEVKIPWTTIGGSASTGRLLGFDGHIDDDDDNAGRDNAMAFSDTTNVAYQNPSVFAAAELRP